MSTRTGFILSALVTAIIGFAIWTNSTFRWPGNQQNYEPQQPIAFSHKVHAGDNSIPCIYCHSGAEKSPIASIPPATTCMNCHKQILKTSPEIKKVVDAIAQNRPLVWTRVHRLPDHTQFDHSRHVTAGFSCQTCHGAVETMERVRQENHITMGYCLSCHRRYRDTLDPALKGIAALGKPTRMMAATDCSVCHR
jgi:hypothetical protein